MNSYGLRIKASENKNNTSGISFQPVIIPDGYEFENHDACRTFSISSAEEQVSVVKKILSNIKESHDDNIVMFLVITYLVAENKHPVKCIITRFVTKNSFIQQSFAKTLTNELLLLINGTYTDYKQYVKVISKIGSCVENFPIGAVAVKNVENELATYLKECLGCCISTLSRDELPPTGRNEVFSLTHAVLRLILYIIQKIDKTNIDTGVVFKDLRVCLKRLLLADSPTDTKSVCGILFVTMYVLENGENSWVDILYRNTRDVNLEDFLSNDSSKLSLLSALATVISVDELHTVSIDGAPAIIKLTDDILGLGDRYSSESTFVLSISRTMVQISRGLGGFGESALYLLDRLFIFVWSHLEHNTDSIQHLSAQILTNIIKFCAHLNKQGNDSAMSKLFSTLSSLERTRKSFYLSLTALTGELGAECVLKVWPHVIEETLNVLHVQAVQASATTSLESLLRHTHTDTLGVYTQWVEPVLRCVCGGEGAVGVLTGLLVDIVKKDEAVVELILPFVRRASSGADPRRLMCTLMLLSVVKRVGRDTSRDLASCDLLRRTAVHTDEEIRFLTLSLIVESPKSTEAFSSQDLELTVWFITYNMNAQSSHFRQLVLSLLKKFFKRLDQSYKTLSKEEIPDRPGNERHYYLDFVDSLTELCFEGLIPGGNHNRRHVALQVLVWIRKLEFANRFRRNIVSSNKTTEQTEFDRVACLLDLLGDSYETNKDMALQLLQECPEEVLYSDKYAAALNLESVIKQASSIKPTECVTAAYKMKLLTKKLIKYIDVKGTTSSEVAFTLLKILLEHVERHVSVCAADLAAGARHAPLHGLLLCVTRTLEDVEPALWSQQAALSAALVAACRAVCACAAPVLHSAAPEGHMPHTDLGKIRFEDGSEVTAQMVLLCAWRSVKEVSLILSSVVSLLSRSGEAGRVPLVKSIGESFLRLLSDVKHRGAFEQIYVGFSRMLACLWREQSPELHGLPRAWLAHSMEHVRRGAGHSSETRRSAGLPYVIQALVVSELQSSPWSFPCCVRSLLQWSRSASLSTRCHCMNILRALYRCSALGAAPDGAQAGAALQRAVEACESTAWIERNSGTLLFSCLMVRVFGVTRSRAETLCVRNRMTGRIFFLRYPQLYDFMLSKLGEASVPDALHPALYPVLLVLARLYPSALEGSVSILKLESFVPGVMQCGGAPSLRVRQLAARALPPLLTRALYLSQLRELFTLLSDRGVKRNLCHGTLLQIIKLVDHGPDSVVVDEESRSKLISLIESSVWILEHGVSSAPCYVIVDEYIKLIHVILWKFTSLLEKKHLNHIRGYLTKLLFDEIECRINPGREVCLAHAVHLLLLINDYDDTDDRWFVYGCLGHDTYEVVLAMLDYLLIVRNELYPENTLQEHIKEKCGKKLLETLRGDPEYVKVLCRVLKSSRYPECTQKCLLALTLEPNTQKHIVSARAGTDDVTDEQIMTSYMGYIQHGRGHHGHVYLRGLLNFMEEKLNDIPQAKIMETLEITFTCSLAENRDETRGVVAEFLERNLEPLLNFSYDELNEADGFLVRASLYCTSACLLEDEAPETRARAARAVARLCDVTSVVSARARRMLLAHVQSRDHHALGTLAVLALAAIGCQVRLADDLADECRVFDHNEKYNTNSEEAVWTRECADAINALGQPDVARQLCELMERDTYRRTFETLCGDNALAFRTIVEENRYIADRNPKVDVFVKRLRRI